jgi:2-polyprenyl-6-methoxyphenol hydroxylase-like FAD-dependent oxidoreductase
MEVRGDDGNRHGGKLIMAASSDMLVIGAGPAGLTAAAEAIRHGLSVRVIDQNESRSMYSKALVVHSRSLEIFQDMGLVANVINSGQKFRALNIYAANKSLARIVFQELDWRDALFPFWLSIPQSETERCLEDHLHELGGSVERDTELIDLKQFPDHVHVTLKHQGDSIESVDVPWVVGCDGARSLTRKLLGLELNGKAEDDVFILGDVRIDWDLPEDEGSNILSPDGIVLIVPMPEMHRYRIICHMPGFSVTDQPEITLELLQSLMDRRTTFKMKLSDLTWSSVFSSKHFVASQHRQGRVFIAGDAAHIHSPVGGQGLNSGIQDAYNLVWKLALTQHGQALPALLDSYAVERHTTAQNLISTVGTATKIVTLRDPLTQTLRNWLAGILLDTKMIRNRMGRGVAMLDIEYKDSPAIAQDLLPESMANHVLGRFKQIFKYNGHGFSQGPSAGMRAPNVLMPADGAAPSASLFDLYRGTHYTLMIFSGVTGSPAPDTLLEIGAAIQTQYKTPIQPYIVTVEPPSIGQDNRHMIVDTDKSIHEAYSAWQPCLYLIRPDKYIAYRSQTIDQNLLTQYLDHILIRNPTK